MGTMLAGMMGGTAGGAAAGGAGAAAVEGASGAATSAIPAAAAQAATTGSTASLGAVLGEAAKTGSLNLGDLLTSSGINSDTFGGAGNTNPFSQMIRKQEITTPKAKEPDYQNQWQDWLREQQSFR